MGRDGGVAGGNLRQDGEGRSERKQHLSHVNTWRKGIPGRGKRGVCLDNRKHSKEAGVRDGVSTVQGGKKVRR